MPISDEELNERFRAGFKAANEIAARLGKTVLPNGTHMNPPGPEVRKLFSDCPT